MLNPGSSTFYSYKVDSFTTKPNDMRYSSDDEEVAEIVSNGNGSIKVVGKKIGKTTIHIREVSGSNQEDSVEVEVFSLGQTQESAIEIQPVFGNKEIFANQTGWLKFRAPETAKYAVQTLISQDTITSKHRIETNFYNETQWRGYHYRDFAIGGRSYTSGGNLPLSYEKDDYVYVHIANRKVNAPYYLTFSYTK
ncbi:hypothetical protein [Candidatus Enterococcus clewellii]|uniref:Uncharacterized protein n=1 Tax=Candidatus Enterococcus clewellii TaxID=1834193 RepID=A0A242K4Y2_9ENTE|nr:hypothetical protein A5888_002606 [Enterococcus sp. 9E7_DIV0242]